MEEEFRALLIEAPEVAALVGTRINFGAHPQGAPLPGLVLNVVSDAEGFTLAGPDGLSEARVQVDAYALSYGDAKRLGRAVRLRLNGHQGPRFQGIFLVGSQDSREGGSNESSRPYRVSQDFLVNFNV